MAREDHRTREFYRFFLTAYPGRTAVMILLMVLAGIAEGVGVVALVPVLDLAGQGTRGVSPLGQKVAEALALVGLEPSIGLLLGLIVAAITLKALFLYLANIQIGFTVARVTRDLRLDMLRAVLDVRWRHFGTRTIGQFSNAISGETARSAAAYREACKVLAAAVQVLAYLAVATAISWRITIGLLVVSAGLTVVYRRFFKTTREAGREQTRLARSLSSRLVDVLQGIKPLKAMGRQKLVWPLLEAETQGLNEAQRRQVVAAGGLRAFQEPVLTLLLAIGLYVVMVVSAQPLTEVLVMAFVFYRFMQHINTLQVRYNVMVVGESAFFSFRDELTAAHKAVERKGGDRVLEGLREGIRLEGVRFAYDEHPVLDGVDMEIPVGAFVAIFGESGSGKTTLADIISGLFEPDEGRVVADGIPLEELNLEAWRHAIGYVPQEMLLFNDTVYRNVTLGDESLSREEAERALRMAGAWGFVQATEGGLDHRIGERGGMLSGGQRQRIAIARALVTRPSLLILDEVTTALDPKTEQEICRTLAELGDEVTILSISHQPAMRAVADMAYLMQNGKLERVSTTAVAG